MVKDPVCGMKIEKKNAAGTSYYKGKRYYFCSRSCKENFDTFPLMFIEDGGEGEPCRHPKKTL